jgi:hypothetical protein
VEPLPDLFFDLAAVVPPAPASNLPDRHVLMVAG